MSLGRVLIVDDEPDLRELLDHNFRNNDFETRQAADGLAACRLIGEERPDLVLLDLMLPDLDGREVCRMVRSHANPSVAATPILMLTALSAPSDRVTGLHVGADDYLAKPFSVEEVVLRAKRLVAERKRQDHLIEETSRARSAREHLLESQDLLFHDLKNQLVVVKGFSGRICDHADLLPPEKVRGYAQAIRQSATRLGLLAEEMLLLRRIEGNGAPLPTQRVDLAGLTADVVETFEAAAGEKGLSLLTDSQEGLSCPAADPSSVRIALSCLVENAVKYGREGGVVRVSCRLVPNGRVAVAVADDGVGIPEGELDRVFERFYRGSNALNRAEGTGLGLYFAKSLVEAMGGTISAESELGKGSCFRIELPD